MLNPKQFVEEIIRPTMMFLEGRDTSQVKWGGQAAEELMLGTALVESDLSYLRQLGGPALGIYQMEPATAKDILENYVGYRGYLGEAINMIAGVWPMKSVQIQGNLFLATALTRIHYRRVPEPLPAAGDTAGQARYWKEFYNTEAGKGTPEKYLAKWKNAGSALGF